MPGARRTSTSGSGSYASRLGAPALPHQARSLTSHPVTGLMHQTPSPPAPVADLTGDTDCPELEGANSITTARIGSSYYAIVTSFEDDGVQMINTPDPAHPFDPLLPHASLDLTGDGRAACAGQARDSRAIVLEYAVGGGGIGSVV